MKRNKNPFPAQKYSKWYTKHDNMQKFNIIALANSFAIIDFILHPFFHLWIAL